MNSNSNFKTPLPTGLLSPDSGGAGEGGLGGKLLKQYWGYDAFRGIQEDIINSITEGRDTLGLMPTGGGKSITFQVPALAKEGLCLVITPLIALMKDQVQNLKKRGIKALAIYSGMSRQEIIVTLENCIFGNFKFLYISPERLDTEIFRTKLQKMKISMITVDESHCISQWGYDFRPAYLKIAEIRKLLPGIPILALTATATPAMINDLGSSSDAPLRMAVSKVSRKVSSISCTPSRATNSTRHNVKQNAAHICAKWWLRSGKCRSTRRLNPLSAISCRCSAKNEVRSLSLFSIITILF